MSFDGQNSALQRIIYPGETSQMMTDDMSAAVAATIG